MLPLALAAALAALVAPAPAVAERSNLLLAGLVLLTALGIAPADLRELRRRPGLVLALSVVPLALLAPAAWAVSRAFDGPVREGTVALGLAPTEVAAAGLVALARGSAAMALAVVAGSLVVSALAAPPLAVALGGAEGSVSALAGGFAAVVLVPLGVGLAARAALPRLARAEGELAGAAALVLAALVYAALSAAGREPLGEALLAAGAFLVVSAALAAGLWRLAPGHDPAAVALTFALRDFAVAAGVANQAFGSSAAAVPGVYGVLMLLAGAAAASVARRA